MDRMDPLHVALPNPTSTSFFDQVTSWIWSIGLVITDKRRLQSSGPQHQKNPIDTSLSPFPLRLRESYVTLLRTIRKDEPFILCVYGVEFI
jgi:hypothetical protein